MLYKTNRIISFFSHLFLRINCYFVIFCEETNWRLRHKQQDLLENWDENCFIIKLNCVCKKKNIVVYDKNKKNKTLLIILNSKQLNNSIWYKIVCRLIIFSCFNYCTCSIYETEKWKVSAIVSSKIK